MKKRILFAGVMLVVTVCTAFAVTVTTPDKLPEYYSSVDNKSGKTLFDALHSVVLVGFKSLGYDGALTAYKKTDLYPADSVGKVGLLWDMYGACGFDPNNSDTECGNYSKECDCYNREHSIPKSWWGKTKNETYSDIFHLVPTDGYVNNRRSAYAFGEVQGTPTYSYKGAKLGSAKTLVVENTVNGNLSVKCSTSPVFEPLDQYKGDFARGYMGILVHYTGLDMSSSNGASIFSGKSETAADYGLTDYGIALLLKWHRMDPVSKKEIDRNNGIQETQGNRNPFIDYPELAEYLWGAHAGEKFDLSSAIATFDADYDPSTGTGGAGSNPAIVMPVGSVDIGFTEVGSEISKTITVKGVNLTGAISFSLAGADKSAFSLSRTSMTQAEALAGASLTITYNPATEGVDEATLVISGGGLSKVKEIGLNAECCQPYVVTLVRNGMTAKVKACGDYLLPAAEDESAACSGEWAFKGWWSEDLGTFVEGQTDKPKFVLSVSQAETLYAVYAKNENGGGEGVPANTKLWAEGFGDFSAGDVPDDAGSSTTVYGDAEVTYSCNNGGGTTKIFNEKLAGGTAPELLIAKKNGSLTVSGVPTGGAVVMTLSFKTNKTTGFTVATSTKGITVGDISYNSSLKTMSCDISNSDNVETFDFVVTYTASDNSRVDNFELVVKTAGSTGITTYKKDPCGGGSAPSGVETTELETPAKRVIENGVMYIIRDGKRFTVQGALVE